MIIIPALYGGQEKDERRCVRSRGHSAWHNTNDSNDCHSTLPKSPGSGSVGKKGSLAQGDSAGPCKDMLVTLSIGKIPH